MGAGTCRKVTLASPSRGLQHQDNDRPSNRRRDPPSLYSVPANARFCRCSQGPRTARCRALFPLWLTCRSLRSPQPTADRSDVDLHTSSERRSGRISSPRETRAGSALSSKMPRATWSALPPGMRTITPTNLLSRVSSARSIYFPDINDSVLGRRLIGHVAGRFLQQEISSMLLFCQAENPSCAFFDALGGERLLSDSGEFHGGYGWRNCVQESQCFCPCCRCFSARATDRFPPSAYLIPAVER